MTRRFWVSWYSGNYESEGCTKPPFQVFTTGYRSRNDDSGKDDCTMCAAFEAEDVSDIWKLVAKHFPDYVERFCEETGPDWETGDRFPNQTTYRIAHG